MTARAKSGRGAPQATWKDPRRRPELLKAIGASAGIVILTALVIFLVQPDDSTSTTPIQTPVPTAPTGATGSTPSGATGSTDSTVPIDPTATSTPTPSDSTGTTVPTASSTTTAQP